MTDLRCRHCGVPHFEHPDVNKSGGVGRLLSWDGDLCPVCIDRRRELAAAAARRYIVELLDPTDDYVTRTEPEQATLAEVL